MADKRRGPWPFGLPTKPCDVCRGSGARPNAIAALEASRKPVQGKGTIAEVRCSVCFGRGRVIDEVPVGGVKS